MQLASARLPDTRLLLTGSIPRDRVAGRKSNSEMPGVGFEPTRDYVPSDFKSCPTPRENPYSSVLIRTKWDNPGLGQGAGLPLITPKCVSVQAQSRHNLGLACERGGPGGAAPLDIIQRRLRAAGGARDTDGETYPPKRQVSARTIVDDGCQSPAAPVRPPGVAGSHLYIAWPGVGGPA